MIIELRIGWQTDIKNKDSLGLIIQKGGAICLLDHIVAVTCKFISRRSGIYPRALHMWLENTCQQICQHWFHSLLDISEKVRLLAELWDWGMHTQLQKGRTILKCGTAGSEGQNDIQTARSLGQIFLKLGVACLLGHVGELHHAHTAPYGYVHPQEHSIWNWRTDIYQDYRLSGTDSSKTGSNMSTMLHWVTRHVDSDVKGRQISGKVASEILEKLCKAGTISHWWLWHAGSDPEGKTLH